MQLLARFFLLFVLVALPPFAASAETPWLYRGSDIPPDPAWRFGTLPNGLRYAVRQNELPDGQVSIRLRIAAGSLHEEDSERGWAHLIEHLAFRGSKSFGDREARHIWQRLGASFGSDTNASTGPTQTIYKLDLPDADLAEVEQSLDVIAEMADSALFDPATVEAEKKIVMAEKGRRPELTTRYIETSWPLFYAGLKIAERDTIGTDATLAAADAAGLRAFYERWYRPERATLVIVGDADPDALERLVAESFGGWQGSGPAPQEPDTGSIARLDERAATLAYEGAPYGATLMWLRPYRDEPATKANEKTDFARALAARIVNRRIEAKARNGASYVSAGIGESAQRGIAEMTQLSVTARDGKWREALEESFAILADAMRAPPSAAEIEREIRNLRRSADSAVEGEPTVRSQQWAGKLVSAVDDGTVVATAATQRALLEEFAPQMTPALLAQATRELFEGEGPRIVLLSPAPVAEEAALAALAAAERAPPAERAADRVVDMDSLPPLGQPGAEVSRREIADLGVTIVEFANGSTLTFKETDFEKGSVRVQLRFGHGLSGLAPDQPSLAWLGGVVGPSGIADLDLDAMERLVTGRRIGLNFGVASDAFVLGGSTNREDLADQLRLLAAKLAYPRWDESLFARFKAGALESYDLAFASAGARAGREAGGFLRSDDERWAPVEKTEIEAATLGGLRDYFTPLIANGPVEAIIVGDVDLETAVAAMQQTIAALPPRAPARTAAGADQVRPPAPSPEPETFTHQGDEDEAYALIGWSTFGGTGRMRERRALTIAATLLRTRLFDELREAEGASYSPGAVSINAEEFPAWGIFYASSELKPESIPIFFRVARRIVADLAAKPAEADEYARAVNPLVSGIERRLKTNGYWLDAMEAWTQRPERIEQVRTYLSDYRGITAEEVRAAVARHVADAGDWSMVVLPDKASEGGN